MSPDLQESLAGVRWIGGAACAGKTAVAERLAAEYGLAIYHCDEHFDAHRQRVDPARHPHFHRIMNRSCEQLWMRPVAEQVAELRGFYQEELEMVFEDLAATPGPVVAEGAGLLPARVSWVVQQSHRAVWLQADGELRRRRARRRSRTRRLLAQCRDPEEAFRRWMERDDLFAAWIVAEAQRTGEPVLAVDGRRTLEETVAAAARCLGLSP